jgi:arginine decarboxylase
LIDVTGLAVSGYQATDWLRAERAVDLGMSDHRRIEATVSSADDEQTVARLLDALDGLVEAAPAMDRPHPFGPPSLPSLPELDIEPVIPTRRAT